MRNVKSEQFKNQVAPLSWDPFVPSHIANLVPYPPGKPIAETQREFGISEVVKSASNENPLGPSSLAIQKLQNEISALHRYPDGSHFELKNALAQKTGFSTQSISIGNGSNEFIDLLIRVFVGKDENIVMPRASFVAYKLCAQLQGCQVIETALGDRLEIGADALLSGVNEKTRLVFLANPNNPTGRYLNSEEVKKIAAFLEKKQILFVVDYAYWEYVTAKDLPSPESLLSNFGNVIVLQTFSKIYGLAGLRVGYCIAHPQVISTLEKARQPFNVNSLGLVAARWALEDTEHVKKSVALNADSKKQIIDFFEKLGMNVIPSQGNFVLVELKEKGRQVYSDLLKKGVILRPVDNYGLENFLRISCGLESENQKLFKAFCEVRKK